METRSLLASLQPSLSAVSLLTPQRLKMRISAQIKHAKDHSPSTVNMTLDTFSSIDTGLMLPFRPVHSSTPSMQARLLHPADPREQRQTLSLTYVQRRGRRKKVTALVHNPLTEGFAKYKLSVGKPLGVLCPERKQVIAHVRSVSLNQSFGVDTVRRTRAGFTPARTGKVPHRAHWARLGDISSFTRKREFGTSSNY